MKVLLSIVVYKSSPEIIKDYFVLNDNKIFFLQIFDNHGDDQLESLCAKNEIKYIKSARNIGFGAGHNKNIDLFKKHNTANYILILNPDVIITKKQILSLIKSYESLPNVGLLSPRLINEDKSPQNQLQNTKSLLTFIYDYFKKSNSYSCKKSNYNNHYYIAELVHGPCVLISLDQFYDIHGFDERYFLYCEDLDLSRKILTISKNVVIDMSVTVVHKHQRESSKSLKCFLIHLISLCKYFYKWNSFKQVKNSKVHLK